MAETPHKNTGGRELHTSEETSPACSSVSTTTGKQQLDTMSVVSNPPPYEQNGNSSLLDPLLCSSPQDSPASLGEEREGNPQKSPIARLKQAVGLTSSPPEVTTSMGIPESIRSVDEYPKGYGKAAAFETCDPNFLIYRKFEWLHARVLLHIQDELQELEEKLESYDKWQFSKGKYRNLSSRRKDDDEIRPQRKKILEKIKAKLAEYDKFFFSLQKKQTIEKPTKRNQKSFYSLMRYSESITQAETEWAEQHDDLAALAHDAEQGWFNIFLERALMTFSPTLTLAIFRTREQRLKTGSYPYLYLISPYRLAVLSRTILTTLATALFLGHIYILDRIQAHSVDQGSRYAIVMASTLAFSLFCSVFTRATERENAVATGTYCAALTVAVVMYSRT